MFKGRDQIQVTTKHKFHSGPDLVEEGLMSPTVVGYYAWFDFQGINSHRNDWLIRSASHGFNERATNITATIGSW